MHVRPLVPLLFIIIVVSCFARCIAGMIDGVRNFFGRRLAGELDLAELKEAVEADATLSRMDQLKLLEMISKVQTAQATTDELMGPGRRRMHDEMTAHDEELAAGLKRHAEHRRRMQVSPEEEQEKSCGERFRPVEIEQGKMAVSLPFTAKVKMNSLPQKRQSWDLLKEWGVKPGGLPIKFEKLVPIPWLPMIK